MPKITDAVTDMPELEDVNSDRGDKGLEIALKIDRPTAARLRAAGAEVGVGGGGIPWADMGVWIYVLRRSRGMPTMIVREFRPVGLRPAGLRPVRYVPGGGASKRLETRGSGVSAAVTHGGGHNACMAHLLWRQL